MLRWNLSILHNFLYFCHHNFRSRSHVDVKISCSLCKIQITVLVCFLCLYQCKITKNWFFFNVFLTFEHFCYLNWGIFLWLSSPFFIFCHNFTLFDKSVRSSLCIKSWNASTSTSDFFSKCALGGEQNFNLTSQVLMLQSFVDSKIRKHGFTDLIFL